MEDDRCNSEEAIALARLVAEVWRDTITAALNSSPESSWRSVDMQIAFLTGYIARAIDDGVLAERERAALFLETRAARMSTSPTGALIAGYAAAIRATP